eukprot:4906885-Pyramimonas_sp.AAC.1
MDTLGSAIPDAVRHGCQCVADSCAVSASVAFAVPWGTLSPVPMTAHSLQELVALLLNAGHLVVE